MSMSKVLPRRSLHSAVLRQVRQSVVLKKLHISYGCIYIIYIYIYYIMHVIFIFIQGHNHVFKVGRPVPWSRVLLPFYRKKLDRSTQFDAVGYIITLYSSKRYVKTWVLSKFWGSGPPFPDPQWLRSYTYYKIENRCRINQSLLISGMTERRPAMHKVMHIVIVQELCA